MHSRLRPARSSLILGAVIVVVLIAVWHAIDERRQRAAEQSEVEHFEQQRAAEIVRRRETDSRDLIAEVNRKIDAGEDRNAVKAWAEQRQRDIHAKAQREIEG